MAVKLKWPWLGFVIPCFLISFIGYGAHIFVFRHRLSLEQQLLYQICLSMIWFSYYQAIYTSPGKVPANYDPLSEKRRIWRRWCKKCRSYKPERSHHCKTCRTCVLKMDHHCPWTLSCVGFGNMPQFMRFLFWVQVTTGFVLVQLFLRLSVYWQDRDLPAYLISVSELIFVVILFLLDLLVFLSILVLFLRCLYHILFTGMTQIESWEKERLESQMRTPRLWRKIRANYLKVHGKNLPVLTSWTNTDYVELDDLDTSPEISEEVPPNFSIDDVIFPYDIGMWANLINTMGPVYCWLWPWGKPSGTGTCFEVNDEVEDQLDLPWPPDAEDQLKEEVVQNLVIDAENEEYVVRPDFMRRSELGRTRWMNDFGERLEDFGVDIDAEGDDEQVLRNRVTSTNPSDEED